MFYETFRYFLTELLWKKVRKTSFLSNLFNFVVLVTGSNPTVTFRESKSTSFNGKNGIIFSVLEGYSNVFHHLLIGKNTQRICCLESAISWYLRTLSRWNQFSRAKRKHYAYFIVLTIRCVFLRNFLNKNSENVPPCNLFHFCSLHNNEFPHLIFQRPLVKTEPAKLLWKLTVWVEKADPGGFNLFLAWNNCFLDSTALLLFWKCFILTLDRSTNTS